MEGRTIHLDTALQPVPAVAGDEVDLREALTNLVFNAVDALPSGGTIVLRTRTDGDRAIAEVSDGGVGMSEEVRRRCLEPFFSTKGEHGTGLGLAMVYGIVQRHGGTLEVASAPGQGSTFRIALPARAAARPRMAEAGAAPPAPLRVLVVDDEPLVREVVVTYLTTDGHAVETAANGREGLERFRAGRFDLVLTDQAMPEMSGEQMAAAIKQEAAGTPVLLMTGFGDMLQAAGTQPGSVDHVLGKLVRLATLRAAIGQVMDASAGASSE